MIRTEIDQATFERYASNPAAFIRELSVDVDGVIRQFGKVMDPWQKADFEAMYPAMLRVVGKGKGKAKPRMRAYWERGRGHSKTTDLAVIAIWLLVFGNRPLRGYVYASDKSQAQLTRHAIELIVRMNPWLSSVLVVNKETVTNIATNLSSYGSELEISSSDVASSWGVTPSFMIADEYAVWPDKASGLWDSIISSAAKRANCLLMVISNAGFMESWQWKIREAIRVNDAWIFSRLDGPQASWLLRSGVLEEQQSLLPQMAYTRVWSNEWVTGGGDALTEADILAAFQDGLEPMPQKLPGWEYVAGLDLGVSRDASAIVVVGIRRHFMWDKSIQDHGRIRLCYTRRWKPVKGQKVNLQEIEDALKVLHGNYGFRAVNYDPWNSTHLAQRLVLSNIPMVEVPPTGQNLQKQASTLIEAFSDRRLDFYPEPQLLSEIRKLRVEERSYGFRLVSPSDATGHGDLASALALALLAGTEVAGQKHFLLGAHGGGWNNWDAYDRQRQYDEMEMRQLASAEWNDRQEGLKRLLASMGRPN